MHWADKIAKKVVQLRPDRQEYVCAAGISPSGAVHIGNFRDVATAFFVAEALKKMGRNARLLFSWDDFDRFRKVPKNVDATFEQYIGMPLSAVPDPQAQAESYADRFEQQFIESMKTMHIDIDYRFQTKEYKSGRYADGIITALQKRGEIYDILARFRTQPWDEEERKQYIPLSVYSEKTGKDNTTILELSNDCTKVRYRCDETGFENDIDIRGGGMFKLPWKVDWPMRWAAEGVTFEPGGKDHATPGGSFDVAKVIAKKIYGVDAPIFEGYAFVRLKGETSKMSGSSGVLLTPGDLLAVYQPEILRWMFARFAPNKEFNIALDEDVLKSYDEFDRGLKQLRENKGNPDALRALELATIENRDIVSVPFRQLSSFAPIFQGNDQKLADFFTRIGTPYEADDLTERRQKAESWMRSYSPESINDLRETPNAEYYAGLEDEEKGWLKRLADDFGAHSATMEELNTLLYAIPKREDLTDDEKKKRQRRFFTIVYNMLIGKDAGPRMSTFLFALDKSSIEKLINFKSA